MSQTGREFPQRPIVGVGVLLLRKASVLLVRRGRAPLLGQWSFPGGAQKLGETAEAAARRELQEETSLLAGELKLAGYADAIEADANARIRYHYTILDFCGVYQTGIAHAGGDADAVAWADFKDLRKFHLTEAALTIIDASRRLLFQASSSE
jgi:8-oxo-dGTP diphosphatase